MVRRRKTAASRRRLPAQLVKRVLLHLPADDIEHGDHPVAVAALYNCCLASKAMRSVAQPLLWTSVEIREPDKFSAVRRLEGGRGGTPGRGLGKHTRSLCVWTHEESLHEYDDVRLVLDAMPNLEDVRFQWDPDADPVPVFAFSEIKKLHRATLTSISLDASFPSICPPTFRSLVALTLVAVTIDTSCFVELLTPVSFPSLRRLRLSHCNDLDGAQIFPDFSRALFYQLEVLNGDYDDLAVVPEWMTTQCRVPLVFDVVNEPTIDKAHESRCSHLLLFSPELEDQHDGRVTSDFVNEMTLILRAFYDHIHRSRGTLFALYLPAELDDRVHPFPDSPAWLRLKLVLNNLVRACKGHGVRTVYRPRDDRSSSPYMLPGVSASFVADRDNVLWDLRKRACLTGVGDDHEVYELDGSSGEEDSADSSGEEDLREDDAGEDEESKAALRAAFAAL
ncbi:hypothetical protein JCM8208_002090 [Rhodotorula glutinis]